MAIIKCKMCGGDIELSPDKTFGTCDSCGSTMTFPKVDDEQRAAAFNRGNYFRRIGEFDKALAVYERIVQEDDTDAEAHWCCALCRFGIEYVEDPTTYEWVPTCHRASFDSILEDVDYLAALQHSDGVTRRQYQRDAVKIAEVQRGILATSQSEEPFDVFLCYKETDKDGNRTRDSLMAQDIYYQLTEQGRRVFFARITLEDKAGTQYEPYIFAALHSARVMIVVGTCPENFNAVWVKNEWSRFLALMKKDRSKLLLPCYRDMDPYDLPEQLAVLQSYDMSRIGFLQDLLRGVSKVLDADKKPEPAVRETVIVQGEANSNVKPLLKRGEMAIEDGDWQAADEFYDRVLDIDAECAEAYVGKFLIAVQKKSLEDYVLDFIAQAEEVEQTEMLEVDGSDSAHVQDAVSRFSIPHFLEEVQIREQYASPPRYASAVAYWEAKAQEGRANLVENRNLQRARSFAKGDFRAALEEELAACEDQLQACIEQARLLDAQNAADARNAYAEALQRGDHAVKTLYQRALDERAVIYAQLCENQRTAQTSADFNALIKGFDNLANYEDSPIRAQACRKQLENALQREAAERERKQALQEREKRRKKRLVRNRCILAAALLVLVIAASLVIQNVILPWNHLRTAQSLAAQGEYEAAETEFRASGKSDAEERIQAMYYEAGKTKEAVEAYADAAVLFGEAGDYADAAQRVLHMQNMTLFQRAESLEQSGAYEEAAEMYLASRVEGAEERANEMYYRQAESLEQSGAYEEAAEMYLASRVEDAEERADELYYRAAQACEEAGDGRQAMMLYSKSNGFSDAQERENILRSTIFNKRKTISRGATFLVAVQIDGTFSFSGSFDYSASIDWNAYWEQRDIIERLTNCVEVSAGENSFAVLSADGTVIAAGDNNFGQCDVEDWSDIVSIDVGDYHTVGLKADGTVVAVGKNSEKQCDVGEWKDIIAISAGYGYTVGLKKDGTVVATNFTQANGKGDVGDWKDIVAISAGEQHTVGLRADGTVVATGAQSEGRCDVGAWTDVVSISAGGSLTVGLTADGTVLTTNGTACNWKDVAAVSAGESAYAYLRSDGTVTDTYLWDINPGDVQIPQPISEG